jgi:hypothetical protein
VPRKLTKPAAPRPLAQHQAKTVFVRCPSAMWSAVSTGKVTEFRAATGNAPQLWKCPLPTLAVIYRRRPAIAQWDYRVMLLEAIRREALATISMEGLARAGYQGERPEAFARFRRDWCIHEKKRFEPLRTVIVFTVRLAQEGDRDAVGRALVEHLYGDHAKETLTGPRTIHADRRVPEAAQAAGAGVTR